MAIAYIYSFIHSPNEITFLSSLCDTVSGRVYVFQLVALNSGAKLIAIVGAKGLLTLKTESHGEIIGNLILNNKYITIHETNKNSYQFLGKSEQ